MKLRVEADRDAVAARVADQVFRYWLGPLRDQPGSARPLGLATGRTMEPIYLALVQRWKALPPELQEPMQNCWRSFNLDEYVGLPARDSRSFRAFMDRHLREPLGLDPACMQLPEGGVLHPAHEASRYAAALAAAGGVGLQLLGLGLNGHVGFNEPPCTPDSRCRCLQLSESTRRQNAEGFGGDPQAVPARAITLGLAEILQSREILLVVTGRAKAEVLRRLLEEPVSAELPASWLRGHPSFTVLADREAVS
ncbi:MAG: glucosamine-6-phosphate deaminase [Cyanobacteriota bacterium]|nr:glucosamine-6-phosphate deaminase [Cyanobacteriota bacterium]